MSKDIIVLMPNGKRQKIHCNPDTSFLQVLEDVCKRQGFQPSDYNLKHHNHLLDLTTTVRFSNIPNKACLEMVENETKRTETNVTIGLTLEDGDRRTADFPPKTSLFDIVTSMAATELTSIPNPAILYMRQEVIGVPAMKEKTLRQLGLIGGRAILRLLNKAEEQMQANVSAVYRAKPTPVPEMASNRHAIDVSKIPEQPSTSDATHHSSQRKDQSKTFNPLEILRKAKSVPDPNTTNEQLNQINEKKIEEMAASNTSTEKSEVLMEVDHSHCDPNTDESLTWRQVNLERRLKIEEEVTFLGGHKAVVFMQPENGEDELEDLPDNFYDLTVEEVRKLYNSLHQQRLALEDNPLLTANKRDEIEKQNLDKYNVYKNVVVRVQFPDHMILQGVFWPTNTIQEVINFIKEYLQSPERPFLIFTTPLKEALDPNITLLEAKFVPCVHIHFKWSSNDSPLLHYLKEEFYSKKTSSDAACILASKYRAPSRRKSEEISSTSSSDGKPSTSRHNKVPKWFKQ